MSEQELAEKHCIFLCKSGSNLYGTATERSDTDYVGVFIPPKDYYTGILRVDQVDFRTNNASSGKQNTAEDTDRCIYAVHKFISLLTQCSPNVVELLFVQPKDAEIWTSFFHRIVARPEIFLSKRVKDTFLGYANGQKYKIGLKYDRYTAFDKVLKILDVKHDGDSAGRLMGNWAIRGQLQSINDKPYFTLPKGMPVEQAKEKLRELLLEYGHRTESVLDKGYDPKFASHLLRLLHEAVELFSTGKIVFPLKSAPELLEVKQGKWDLPTILQRANDLEDQVRKLEPPFASSPDSKEIHKLQMQLLDDYWEVRQRADSDLPASA